MTILILIGLTLLSFSSFIIYIIFETNEEMRERENAIE